MSLKKTCKQVPEMSDHLKMPRPPKYGANLQRVSFTLRPEQANFYASLPNASEFLRDLTDQYLMSEERPTSLVAMLGKLGALRKERNDILTSPEYNFDEADFDTSLLDEEDSLTLAVKDGKVYQEYYGDEDEVSERILLPLSVGELKSFRDEHDVDNLTKGRYRIWGRRTAFIDFVKTCLAPDKNVIERLEARLGEIDSEIEKLEERVSSVT